MKQLVLSSNITNFRAGMIRFKCFVVNNIFDSVLVDDDISDCDLELSANDRDHEAFQHLGNNIILPSINSIKANDIHVGAEFSLASRKRRIQMDFIEDGGILFSNPVITNAHRQ